MTPERDTIGSNLSDWLKTGPAPTEDREFQRSVCYNCPSICSSHAMVEHLLKVTKNTNNTVQHYSV
jgi:hypothetical protein